MAEDTYSIGLDVSTNVVGLAVTRFSDNKCVFLSFKKLNNLSLWEKADEIEKWFAEDPLRSFLPNVLTVNVEEPMLAFAMGRTSATTIASLQRFNGIVCHIARKQVGVDPTYVAVQTARKAIGFKADRKQGKGKQKQQVFDYVINTCKNELSDTVWLESDRQIVEANRNAGLDLLKKITVGHADAIDAYVVSRAVKTALSN